MLFGFLVVAAPASARSTDWQGSLAVAFAGSPSPLQVGGLLTALDPLGGAAMSPSCVLEPKTGLVGGPAMVAVTLGTLGTLAACLPTSPVSRVQVLLQPIDPAAAASFKHVVSQREGVPCFDGIYPGNSRRRAPPLHFIAWSNASRDLVLTQDSSMPDALSITFMRTDLHTIDAQAASAYSAMLRASHDVLPMSCKTGH